MCYSSNSKAITLLNFLPRLKTPNHLRCFKSLLVVHGLVKHKGLLRQLLNSSFRVGAVDLALSTFNSIRKPSGFLQNLVIRGLSNLGLHENVLSVYLKSRALNCPSDDYTFPFVIKACSNLGKFPVLKLIHCVVLRNGFDQNVVIQTALVDFYAKNGCLEIAQKLTDKIPQPDLIAWNALLSGYSYNGYDHEVFGVIKDIFSAGLRPNLSTLASLIPVCTRLRCLDIGRSAHGFAVKSGYLVNDFLVPALISMYASDGNLSAARKLFDLVQEKNASVWNAMISGFAQNQMPFEALEVFRKMQYAKTKPNFITFVSIVPSCEITGSIYLAESFHACIIKHGLENHVSVSTSLLSMYAKFRDIDKCELLFDLTPNKNLLSWNLMISGYLNNGEFEKAIELFHRQHHEGSGFDVITLISVLPLCCDSAHLSQGMALHSYIIKNGFASEVSLANSLITMYFKCGSLDSGRLLFEEVPEKSVVSWNALIGGYRSYDLSSEVLATFKWMVSEKEKPNSITLLNLLPVCCSELQGKSIHAFSIRAGILRETPLLTSLIFMYARFSNINLCLSLFEKSEKRDISLRNTMISVYTRANNAEKAISLFLDLLRVGIQPDHISILTLISAYVQLHNSKLGDSVMAYVISKGFDKEVSINNALIDLYAKSGNIFIARKIFEGITEKDDVSWNAMLNGYCLHGDGEAAFKLFSKMQVTGIKPNEITFLSILSACSHSGLVEQAMMVFKSMDEQGVPAKTEHFACIVDLLGRKGEVKEAYEIVKKLQFKPSISLLESLLGACRNYGDVEIGEKVSEMLIEMEPENPGPYVMLSSIYAGAGRWIDADRVRSRIEARKLRKVPGFSFLNAGCPG